MGHSPTTQSLRTTSAPPAPDVGPYSIVVCTPDHDVWVLQLKPGQRYTLGRDSSCDIVLAYPWVSQRHAEILGGDPPAIVDLGSRNGTFLDSERLEPDERHALHAGSALTIGGISLLVQRGEETHSRRGPRWSDDAELGSHSRLNIQRRAKPSAAPPLLVTSDPRMQELYEFVKQIAESDVSVLILGETGVGKELFASAIHEHSTRAERSLVVLNCAAIPENLVESELFGYERGAFSGAVSAKPGLFEAANGSTLFLDEVGDLPMTVQPKLLRVLETGEVLRLGSTRPHRVDVRVVAATNRDLQSIVTAGTFRMDLFYRLNGITVTIPPLRERHVDISQLAEHFASTTSVSNPQFTPEAMETLCSYPWPGNVRELKSAVKRATLLAQGGVIDARHLVFGSSRANGDAARHSALFPTSNGHGAEEEIGPSTTRDALSREELDRRERRRIQEALERTGGNQKDAAKLLGISRRTLIKRLDRYAMVRPRKRRELPDDAG